MRERERERETDRQTDRQNASEGGADREGDTESEAGSRFWALARSPMWGSNPRDHDLRQSRMLNLLSHPGAPKLFPTVH